LGMGLGSFAGGAIYDGLGSYAWLFLASFAIGAMAVVLAFTFRRATKMRGPEMAPPTPQPSERPGEAVPLLWIAPARGGPEMAPNPPAFGASRRSRAAPLDRASPWGPRHGPKPPRLRSAPAKPGRSSKTWRHAAQVAAFGLRQRARSFK